MIRSVACIGTGGILAAFAIPSPGRNLFLLPVALQLVTEVIPDCLHVRVREEVRSHFHGRRLGIHRFDDQIGGTLASLWPSESDRGEGCVCA